MAAEFNVESLSGEPLKQIDRRMGKAFVEKNRRMDAYFSEGNPDSIESFEFVDVGRSKRPQNTARVRYTAKIRMPSKRTFEAVSSSGSKELQEVAESASFVKPRQLLNGYNYPVPTVNGKPAGYEYPKPEKQITSSASATNPTDRTGKRLESAKPTGFGFDPNSNTNNNNGFEPKPFNTRPTEILSTTFAPRTEKVESNRRKENVSTSTSTPLTTQLNRGSTTYQSSLERERQEKDIQLFTTTTTTSTTTSQTTPRSTTAFPKTYSTAKKLTSKAKESSFYTPTIPTITNKVTKEVTTERTPKTTTPTPSVSEHALEMMKTLQQLGEIEASADDNEKYQGQRAGLEVPPSSGPSALHSLALYFATTPVDTNSTEPTPSDEQFAGKTNSDFELSTEANTPAITSAHLSQRTVEQYQALFEAENKRLEPNNTNKINDRFHDDNDLDAENSRNPIYAAAGSPQIRELAQVFTHALSAYLQDPETFRKILSEIRPTEPPPLESNEIENRFNNQDVFHGQEASYAIPKTATTSTTSTTTSPTEDFEVLDFSDVTLSTQRQTTSSSTTTESPQTTTKINVPVPVNRILPPFSNNAIDRTPGSDLVVETLENEANNFFNRQGKSRDDFDTTTTDANPLAIEINGGLALSTTFPFESDELSDKDVSSQTESNYFPGEKSKNKKVNSPYGKGVKPTGSSPLTKLESEDIPEQWGDEGTTTVFDTTETTPTISPDLLPPFKATTILFTPSKYYEPPVHEDEESLQRSQSQSIFGNHGNSVKSSAKRGKSYFNYVTVHDETSTVQTTRFGERIQSTTTELPDTTTYSSTNNLNSRGHFITRKITTLDDTGSTPLPDLLKTTIPDTGKISPNSKTTVSYSIFLDPLTINDGLMESSEDAKKANNKATYLPRDLTTEGYTEAVTSAPTFTVSTRTASVSTRKGKELNASPTATYNNVDVTHEKDVSEADFVTAMQKRANEMFGGLNDTQADHLMNVMKQADKNKNVRRLILLLIQTCDDDYNKTVEESRNALLNALIQMDTKDFGSDIHVVKTRFGGHEERRSRIEATEAPAPAITTYRSADHNKYTSAEATVEYSYVTSTSISDQTTTSHVPTEAETTTNSFPTSYSETTEQTTTDYPLTSTSTEYPTTFFSSTTTTTSSTTPAPAPSTTSRKPRTRTRTRVVSSRVQKSLGLSEDFVAESSSNYGTDNAQNKHSDARALELLRSLYSLASRWG